MVGLQGRWTCTCLMSDAGGARYAVGVRMQAEAGFENLSRLVMLKCIQSMEEAAECLQRWLDEMNVA